MVWFNTGWINITSEVPPVSEVSTGSLITGLVGFGINGGGESWDKTIEHVTSSPRVDHGNCIGLTAQPNAFDSPVKLL